MDDFSFDRSVVLLEYGCYLGAFGGGSVVLLTDGGIELRR